MRAARSRKGGVAHIQNERVLEKQKKKKEDDLERRYRVTILQARESFQLTYAMKLRNERQNDRALLRDVL